MTTEARTTFCGIDGCGQPRHLTASGRADPTLCAAHDRMLSVLRGELIHRQETASARPSCSAEWRPPASADPPEGFPDPATPHLEDLGWIASAGHGDGVGHTV